MFSRSNKITILLAGIMLSAFIARGQSHFSSLHAGKHHPSCCFNPARLCLLESFVNEEETGYKAGGALHLGKKFLLNANLWDMNLENRLLYTTSEDLKDASPVMSELLADVSFRLDIRSGFFAAFDLGSQKENALCPFSFKGSGELGLENENGFGFVIRYNYCSAVSDPLISKQFMSDLILDYSKEQLHIGVSALNLLSCRLGTSCYDDSRKEISPVLNFSPAGSFFIKGSLSYYF